jgi:DNA transformation protein
MAHDQEFVNFVFDQLQEIGEFETKNVFGSLALVQQGEIFGKIKYDKFWLKVDESSQADFEKLGMEQYAIGKDKSKKLPFFETPIDVLENRDKLKDWATKAIEIALKKID